MSRSYFIIILFLARCYFSQENLVPVAKVDFNNGLLINEACNAPVKCYNFLWTDDRFGNNSSAVFFHGNKGSYLNLGCSNDLKPPIGSVSLWFRLDHIMLNGKGTEINPILITHSVPDEDYCEAIFMGYDIGTGVFNFNTTTSQENQVTLYSNRKIALRKWHHVVAIFDNAKIALYLDGKLEAESPRTFQNKYLEGDSIIVGNWISQKNIRFFNGAVDDIRIFDKALNQDEVINLFNEPNPNKNNWIYKAFLIGLFVIVLIGVIITVIRFRLRVLLKREQEKNKLKNELLEQEIKMLRAQMDPHFIFNSLNSIQQFILTNENLKAEVYLAKFSKLLRKTLESNVKETISLNDEIDYIRRYVEIESLRFGDTIDLKIEVGNGVNANETYIPHMMIQPFVENAIWHGLQLKKGEKWIKLGFEKLSDNKLHCVIEDNGIGRVEKKQTQGFKTRKSMAVQLIRQRLELLSKIYKEEFKLEILDKYDETGTKEGVRVELIIPIHVNTCNESHIN